MSSNANLRWRNSGKSGLTTLVVTGGGDFSFGCLGEGACWAICRGETEGVVTSSTSRFWARGVLGSDRGLGGNSDITSRVAGDISSLNMDIGLLLGGGSSSSSWKLKAAEGVTAGEGERERDWDLSIAVSRALHAWDNKSLAGKGTRHQSDQLASSFLETYSTKSPGITHIHIWHDS